MLLSSTKVGDEDTVEIPIGRAPLMLFSSIKIGEEDMVELP
jgi:hypothetical protein